MIPGLSWSRIGIVGIAVFMSAGIWTGIVRFGPKYGVETRPAQIAVFIGIWCIVLLLRYGPFLNRYLRARFHRWQEQKKNALPEDESRLVLTRPRSVTVGEIRLAMRHLYGRRWGRKVRILLLAGKPADVEMLTPGLTAQLWQEDKGTLLLWGGDLSTPVDEPWLKALRQLRYRPADGVVWVTSAFDQQDTSLRPALTEDAVETLAHAVSSRMTALGWQLPLYVWSLHPGAGMADGRTSQATGCLLLGVNNADLLAEQLQALAGRLIAPGVQQVCGASQHNFLLTLADRLVREPQTLTIPLSVILSPYRPLPLAGIVFSQISPEAGRETKHHFGMDRRWQVLPDSVRSLPAALRPCRPGFRWSRLMAPIAALAIVLCATWIAVSFISNRNLIHAAQAQVATISEPKQPLSERLHALLTLQKTLARLQYRADHGTPWYTRAGLSQNDTLLAALWPRYSNSAQPLLRDAAGRYLWQQLENFIQLSPDSPLREQRARNVYDQLKLYLMLTRPEHMDAAWFSGTLMQVWHRRQGLKDALWQGAGPSLINFYATALARHPQWRLPADEGLVSQARTMLVRLTGMRNSETTLYQKMLAQVARQYADMRLEDMVADRDAARLFTTDEVVPGMFTRQAWEQAVQPAIDKVVETRRDELDWVLTDGRQDPQQNASPEALKARLTTRYFADFSGAWLAFLNSLRWQRAATLSDAIDQLTLMADVRQSPLVALMNTLNVQGRTGQTGEAISDSLVRSAKNLLGGDDKTAIDQSAGSHGPLDDTFDPVLALMDRNSGGQAQSLQAFLTRVTQVRLRLQQVTNAADPQAMTQALAQTVFQGRAVDLTETRDYGSLVAAGLGQEWSGFGRTVFIQPMEQAWQQVLSPAADSLNAQWQQAVVSDWNSAFGGRYPFNNASSDVSLPLLAKYLNADSGRIAQFLQTRLQGILHKEGSHWVPDRINAQGLTFNPAFLKAVNTLSHISDVAFTEGGAGMSFELRPGTAAGVMQTTLVIDDQKLTYVNQMPAWKRFTWPADTEAPGAALSWISTQAGTRLYGDMSGAWGWIRLLDKAAVSASPGVGSSYSLSWKAPDGRNLNYTLRTEAGEGPLALLKLRNFRLPESIFIPGTSPAAGDINNGDEEY